MRHLDIRLFNGLEKFIFEWEELYGFFDYDLYKLKDLRYRTRSYIHDLEGLRDHIVEEYEEDSLGYYDKLLREIDVRLNDLKSFLNQLK